MSGFFEELFGPTPDPESYEEDFINQVIPEEARELWDVTVSRSELWDRYGAEDHMFLASMYADAVVAGDMDLAEDFLEYLETDWDNYDVRSFYEAYEALKG